MNPPTRRYDSVWATFNAEALRKMSALWGAPSKMPKEDRVAYLIAAPKDPHLVDAALARMMPFERAALNIVQWLGGTSDINALGIAVRTTGLVPATDSYARGYNSDPVSRKLLDAGVVMPDGGLYYSGSVSYSETKRLFADDRLLARLPPPDYKPLALKRADPPTASTVRHVPSVMLEVISVLRAIDDLGGIGMTQAGVPRVSDMRKVARKLDWEKTIKIDGLTFPQPMNAYYLSMRSSGLLVRKNDVLANAVSLEQIVRSPPTEVIRNLILGILQTGEWLEFDIDSVYNKYKAHAPASRLAVLIALRCLREREAWYHFADFERALFERIGEFHSIVGIKSKPYFFRDSADEQRTQMDKWQQDIRTNWEQEDVRWIQAMLQTWLYAFGMVELHLLDGVVDRFRLTDLGRAILWSEVLEEQAPSAETQTGPWVVQPNFDVVVYLARASTEQIAFLEQYAERIQVSQHTAQYRLTRDSVYEGFQRGGSADQLIAGLATGSRIALPSNVLSEIRDWSILRDRITVRRRADLIEFTDATERQNAITHGVQGLPVGDRFLLPPETYKPFNVVKDVMDYSTPPDNRSLLVTEEGVISLVSTPSSLLTRGGLDLWAERENSFTWRLTRKSVEQAVQRGRKYPELQAFLNERTRVSLPGLLQVALQVWSGATPQTSLSTVVVFQCAHSAVVDAMLQSAALKPHLVGRLGPDTILVKTEAIDAVRAVLEWTGVPVSAKIEANG